jgi:hypothetical protein
MNLFDALLFPGRPDLTEYGFKKTRLVGGPLFPSSADRTVVPSDTTITQALAGISNVLTILDVEHWTDTALYTALLQRIHALRPELRVGYYATVPKRDYWRAIRPTDDPKYLIWQAENNGLSPVAEQADVLFPSLYTFYSDQPGWVKYATANVSEARRYGKLIYPFIWPQYHDSNPTLKGQLIPGDYWRLQLETLKSLAVDGIVIWGGWQVPWDACAGWWLETMDFVADSAPLPS